MITTLIIFIGCGSKEPIMVTHTEYIAPVTIEGQACVKTIENQYTSCKKKLALETEVCQDKANALAQNKYSKALIDHTFQIEAAKKEKVIQEKNHQIEVARKQEKYNSCILVYNRKEAIGREANQRWRKNGSRGPMPYIGYMNSCRKPVLYNYNQNNNSTYIMKPLLQNFIKEEHCFTNKNICIEKYNHNYETCSGKVLKTTRCVSNCKNKK